MPRIFTADIGVYLGGSGSGVSATTLPVSFAAWFKSPGFNGVNQTIISFTRVGLGGVRLALSSSTNTVVATTVNTGGSSSSAVTTDTYTSSTWAHAGATFSGLTSRIAYLNGVASTEQTTSRDPGTFAQTTIGGSRATVIALPFDGELAHVAAWNVVLTAAEFASLAAGYSPLFIRPQNLINYWPMHGRADASGAEEDWADGRSLAATGSPAVSTDSPRVIYPRSRQQLFVPEVGGAAYTLTVTQGSYALSGQSVTIRSAHQLTVTQSSYALSGQSVTLRPSRQLIATQGLYSLTGQSVVLRAAHSLTATQGSYSLTGQSVTLTKAAASTLNVNQGVYSLSGQSVVLRSTHQLAATAGSYSLTGQNVTLTKSAAGGLVVTQGTYVLTGQAVTLRAARRLTITQGSYALAGQPVVLQAAGAPLIVTQGLYVLTGQDLQLSSVLRLSVTSGLYALTGRSVSLLYSSAPPPLVLSASPLFQRAGGRSRPAQLSSGRRPTPPNGIRK